MIRSLNAFQPNFQRLKRADHNKGIWYFVGVVVLLLLVSVLIYTSTSDVCGPNEYLSDYTCVKHTTCPDAFYTKQAGTRTTDTTCVPITTCESGSWARTPATPSTDAVCVPHSTCNEGQYVKEHGTATTDTICEYCPRGHFIEDSTSGIEECIPHSVCLEGMWASMPGTSSNDTECSPHTQTCPPGEFMSSKGTSLADAKCTKYTICNNGTWLKERGTEFTDNQCDILQECTLANGFDPDHQCLDTPEYDADGNRLNNRSCACRRANPTRGERGFWRPGSTCNTTPCAEHSSCGDNRYLTQEGTQTTDNQCSFLSSCGLPKLDASDCNSDPSSAPKSVFGDRLQDNKCRCKPGLKRARGENTCEFESVDCVCDPCMNDDSSDVFGWVYDSSNGYGCGYVSESSSTSVIPDGTLSQHWMHTYNNSQFHDAYFTGLGCASSPSNTVTNDRR